MMMAGLTMLICLILLHPGVSVGSLNYDRSDSCFAGIPGGFFGETACCAFVVLVVGVVTVAVTVTGDSGLLLWGLTSAVLQLE